MELLGDKNMTESSPKAEIGESGQAGPAPNSAKAPDDVEMADAGTAEDVSKPDSSGAADAVTDEGANQEPEKAEAPELVSTPSHLQLFESKW